MMSNQPVSKHEDHGRNHAMEGFFCIRSFHGVRPAAVLLAALLLAACGSGREGAGPSASSEGVEPGGTAAETPEQLQAASADYAGRDVGALMSDIGAMEVGERLYRAHCASCHGPEGHGGHDAADLTAGHFNYGATPDAIRTTFTQGRKSQMPAMGRSLGEVDLGQLVAYVQSLANESAPATTYQERGQELFAQHCAVCHGDDGKGSTDKGAPNLADGYWQNGDSMMNVRLAITRGIEAECPAQGAALTEPETNLLVAYVLKLIESARTPG
jgi:cytochrome c oxidase cbb3-type subunit 3